MKRQLKSLLSLFLAVFMVASMMCVPVSASDLELNKTSIVLTKGYMTYLEVDGASSVKWSTGDKSIATVNSKGKVSGKGVGTTYVYAKADGETLKCKVQVVAGKISASSSNVVLDEVGDKKTITVTAKGSHSGLTVATTNKKVCTASWVRPIEWDGDKIKFTITANGEGTAKIKVYLKNYPSTCYKYINVTVGDGEEDEKTEKMNLAVEKTSVQVGMNETTTFRTYSTNQKDVRYTVSNPLILSVSENIAVGNYKTITVKGVSKGTATIRFYDKNDTSNYREVTVTVGDIVKYYDIVTQQPTKMLANDEIVQVKVNNVNYYMLVPYGYDDANVKTIIAKKFNNWSYYTLYTEVPSRISATDSYKTVTTLTSSGMMTRYILVPVNYDEVKYNTAVAQYTNTYEPWVIYNVKPTLTNSWLYFIETWTVKDSSGNTVNRYMLVPTGEWNSDKIEDIKNKDQNKNNVYTQYKVYSEYPIINNNTETIIMFTKSGKPRYMVIPKTGFDILKRNDTIQADTGVYEPYIMYSTAPTADSAKGEYVLQASYGSKTVYILCTYAANTTEHTDRMNAIAASTPTGT